MKPDTLADKCGELRMIFITIFISMNSNIFKEERDPVLVKTITEFDLAYAIIGRSIVRETSNYEIIGQIT